jgi:hypothetical protein
MLTICDGQPFKDTKILDISTATTNLHTMDQTADEQRDERISVGMVGGWMLALGHAPLTTNSGLYLEHRRGDYPNSG